MTTQVVGLDIGSRSLRAVEVSDPAGQNTTVHRVHEIALPEGAVRGGTVVDRALVTRALTTLWSEAGFSTRSVVIAAGHSGVLARDLTVPRAPLAVIRESLPFHVQDLLPVPVGEALLDFYPVRESGTATAPTVDGLLIAAVKEAVLANVAAVEGAGLTIIGVDVAAFALARVFAYRPRIDGTVAIIDIGATATQVVIATNGVPSFVRIIDRGGRSVTDAIALRLEVSDAQAESTKLEVSALGGESRPAAAAEALEVIAEEAADLLDAIRSTLSYVANLRPDEPVRALILSGGGARLGGFASELAGLTRVHLSGGDAFASVAVDPKNGAAVHGARESAAVALGLALGAVA